MMNYHKRFRSKMLLALATMAFPTMTSAQDVAATTAPASQPQPGDESLVYEVVEVAGSVKVAPIGMDPIKDAAAWRQVLPGESLGRGQQIRTVWRSKLKLVARPADPPTVILLENSSRMTIEDLAIRNGAAVSRLGLGYGAIRAGVAEGGVRSDMQIATPQAVLSKRGTDIFRVEYMNGRFNMSLSEQGRGLLQAIQLQLSNRGDVIGMKSRFVTPGQQVTHRMAQAIESMTFDRDININDIFGLVGNDKLFTMLNDRGFGFLLPFNGAGNNIFNGQGATQGGESTVAFNNGLFNTQSQGVRSITDGNFGVGQGSLPNLFDIFRNRDTQPTGSKRAMNEAMRSIFKPKARPRLNIGRVRR